MADSMLQPQKRMTEKKLSAVSCQLSAISQESKVIVTLIEAHLADCHPDAEHSEAEGSSLAFQAKHTLRPRLPLLFS
jgi:DNA-binding FrmR family transcriptional regulator